MPDTMVFPGGAVDVEDRASAAALLGDDSFEATLRCAAVREAFEESGVGLFSPGLRLGRDAQRAWRQRVHKDAGALRSLCEEAGTSLAASSLQPWCSFVTPDMEHSKLAKGGFYTQFFVACASEAAVALAAADRKETVSLAWLTPSEALAAVRAGRIAMVPPQFYIISELARACPRLAGVQAYAASPARALQLGYPIKPYPVGLRPEEKTRFLEEEELTQGKDGKAPAVFALAYPGDEAHPVFPGKGGSRHRCIIGGDLGGKARYQLQLEPAPSLPLQEAIQGWYTLAKL